ncbi:MAG: hypothetical protein JW776_07965 [Candidatus Lokiarchaeota archaeon]|nr:hypothetical protein [Candidatus Lokiarchaeota archaeon]
MRFEGYDLRNVPTSTGRADVIMRVMKSALFNPNGYNSNIAFILFPNSTFLSELSRYLNHPPLNFNGFMISTNSPFFTRISCKNASEHSLLKAFYSSCKNVDSTTQKNTLFDRLVDLNIYECTAFLANNDVDSYLLVEGGTLIKEFNLGIPKVPKKMCFILGDQKGFSHLELEQFSPKIKRISLGTTSYLSSTTITLVKWILWKNQIIS